MTKKFTAVDGVVTKARPFTLKSGTNADNLVIMLHGFTSSPYRLHFMADFLHSHGCDIETQVLAGHGGSIERLTSSTAEQWSESVREVIDRNLESYKNIYILGYSFGANLAINLIVNNPQKYDNIRGLVSFGIPIVLFKNKRIKILMPLAKIFKRKYRKKWVNKAMAEYLAERGHHVFIPIKALVDFRKFIGGTINDAKKFDLPTLIMHSRDDRVSDSVSSEHLFKNIPNNDKELFILNKGDHQLEDGARRDYIAKKVLSFIKKH